jgi:hypothetical protein
MSVASVVETVLRERRDKKKIKATLLRQRFSEIKDKIKTFMETENKYVVEKLVYDAIVISGLNFPLIDVVLVYSRPTDSDDMNDAIVNKNSYSIRALLKAGCTVFEKTFSTAIMTGNLGMIRAFEDFGWNISSVLPGRLMDNPDTLHYYIQKFPECRPKIPRALIDSSRREVGNPMPLAIQFELRRCFDFETSTLSRLNRVREKRASRIIKERLNCEYLNKKFIREQLESYNSLFGVEPVV